MDKNYYMAISQIRLLLLIFLVNQYSDSSAKHNISDDSSIDVDIYVDTNLADFV